jgi:hypothetical protein
MAVVIALLCGNAVKQSKFKIIEINEKSLDHKNIIALKQQLLGIILCFFMHLR